MIWLTTLIGGVQKYFMVGLVAFALLATSASLYYRASYRAQYAERVAVEKRLTETVAAFNEAKRLHENQVASLARAEAAARALAEDRRTSRERILNAPQTQNGPVSPVLRCAVTGVC